VGINYINNCDVGSSSNTFKFAGITAVDQIFGIGISFNRKLF